MDADRIFRRLLLASAIPAALAAQDSTTKTRTTVRSPATYVRPEFRPVRYEEDWKRNPGVRASWDDALKHIALLPDDMAWLTVGGAFRWREESVRDYQFVSAAGMQDDFAVSRTTLHGDLHVVSNAGPYARAFAEFRDAQGYNRSLPGGVRITDADRHDWQNAFVEGGWGPTGLRWGRQDVNIGRERLVGIADWINARRAFEGVRAFTTIGPVAIDLMDAHVVAVRIDLPNRPDSTTRFRYLTVGSPAEAAPRRTFMPALWQLYVLQLDALIGPRHERSTYGTRLMWKAPVPELAGAVASFEFEGAGQRGWQGAKSINAWFVATDAQLAFRQIRFAPAISAGYDVASGTKDPAGTVNGTFTALYASAHSHGGMADVFGRGNLAERRVGVSAEPRSWLQLGLVTRRFSRVELADGMYSKANTLFRAASGSTARELGAETDFSATVKVGRFIRLQGGIAEVDPGAFLLETPGGAHVERFSFVGTTLAF